MDSPAGPSPPFSPLFNYMPYKVFWNPVPEANRGLQLPILPSFQLPPSFSYPGGNAVQSPFYPPHTPHTLFNMLAQEAMSKQPQKGRDFNISNNMSPTVQLIRESGERKPNFMTSPVTPPLTPLLPESSAASAVDSNTSACSSGSATTTLAPTRVSARSRRPPAFIEGESSCPICGALLRASELAEHYKKELESLSNDLQQPPLSRKRKESRYSERISEKKSHVQEESRKNVLARVKHNRKSRALKYAASNSQKKLLEGGPSTSSHTQCSSTGTSATGDNQPASSSDAASLVSTCPVCNKTMSCSSEQLAQHVESCLSKSSSDTGSSQEASGSDDECETYTWCGQTRVRVTSFLDPSELTASGFNTVKNVEDDDTPLVVDDDEREQQFGDTQYCEVDVIPCTSEEPAEAMAQSALRNAVISSAADKKDSGFYDDSRSRWTDEPTLEDPEVTFRCLICMDKYSKPLVSVQCWHVHCEECWLRTLGAKKLCPQCNIITSPSDLRRIYL